jgi:FkbM family methyltransferase
MTLSPLQAPVQDLSHEAPFTIKAHHPHWQGEIQLDPQTGRSVLLANGSGGRYTLTGTQLTILWDAHDAEVFERRGMIYLFIGRAALIGPAASQPPGFIVAEIPSTGYMVRLRTKGSDLAVFEQVFLQREYLFSQLPGDARVIVDLGANIGLASLFFAAQYPRARVFALEPDPENFAVLSANIAGAQERITAVRGAIWAQDCDLSIKRYDSDGAPLGDWGVQVGATEGEDSEPGRNPACDGDAARVRGWSMPQLIRAFNIEKIDILKIDIEGAEKELFEAQDLTWLDRVSMIVIETHERFRQGCNAAVLRALEHGFVLRALSGENAIFVRRPRASGGRTLRRHLIITPYFKEDRATLERCIASVRDQEVAVDHLLVADGHAQDWIDDQPVRHLKLDRSHGDFGNTPRGIGALMAVSDEYEGIGFLDADNWLEKDHVSSCLAAQNAMPQADYIIARWNLRKPDGGILELPFDPSHVDTSCFFFLPGSFHMLPHFSMMHRELSLVGDRVFYLALKGADLQPATLDHPTVNYTCLWPLCYKMAGEAPPPEAKEDIVTDHLSGWLNRQLPRERAIINRRAGVLLAG